MAFSLAAALLTLVACLAVLLPAVGKRAPARSDVDPDLAVYQDQLDELKRDLERGVVDTREADEARAEIGRRILKVSAQKEASARQSKLGRVLTTLAILLVPVVGWGVYSVTGSPHLPAQPLQARLSKNPAEASIEELVARAEAHLTANPQDGRGWEVLAPIYYRVGRFPESSTAWRNSIRLLGDSPARQLGLGDALIGANGGMIVEDARAAFERALELDPQNPKARFAIAAALSQEGKQAEAEQAWRALRADLPTDSPWLQLIAQALGENDGNLISDNAQNEMIENMVAGLDQRLRDEPQDPEGWQRLVHSYVVLQKLDAAQDALARGLDALGAESDAGKNLTAFAAERGVGVKE